ncbi:hypothetical protein ES703_26370 [subsurface metagenome]
MTQYQHDVIKVVWDLIQHGAVEVEIASHVFGTALKIYPDQKKGKKYLSILEGGL